MNKNKAVHQVCTILFLLFTFAYLYFQQGETLALAQDVFSNGVTTYSLFWGAIIIPLVLLFLQKVVAFFSGLPDRFHAWSYAPSLLLLALITDINAEALRQSDWSRWLWITPLAIALYVALTILFRKLEQFLQSSRHEGSTAAILWPNFAILLVLILTSASLPRTSAAYLYELKVERLIREGQYEQARQVGIKSLESTRRLTELRMYTLAQLDSLPDYIFTYPQDYGAEGLLCVADTSNHFYRFDAEDISLWLGAMCGKSIHSTQRYLTLIDEHLSVQYDSLLQVDSLTLTTDSLQQCHNRELSRNLLRQRRVLDYQLCYYLLQKDLDSFCKLFPRYSTLRPEFQAADTVRYSASLPRAYREALAICRAERCDESTLSQYHRYKAQCDSEADEIARRNYARRNYGDTYWWYYDFSKAK